MAALAKLTSSIRRENVSPIPSLLEISLDEIGHGFSAGTFAATDLVRAYLNRIQEVNDIFKSVLETNGDALRIAAELDEEARKSGPRGPLHGVPILLKDNIVTLDDMEATAGSYALIGAKPAHEATVVTKLREAGAIILGKASLTEWANCRWNNAATGWCPRGGQASGPLYPKMKASGSSTGSAISTSLGLTFASLGTETDGSICNPAGKGNLVGLKPTTGLVARDGIIPASNRLDTVGPFTRSVKDAAAILTVIAGKSSEDSRTHHIPFDIIPDYTKACEISDISGIRIGIPRHCIKGIQKDEAVVFEKALKTLKALGAEIVDNIQLLGAEEWESYSSRDTISVTVTDFADSLEHYFNSLQTNPQGINSLQELLEYTKAIPEENYPTYNADTFEIALDRDHYSSEKYKKLEALSQSIATDGGIQGALDREKLDVLVVPTAASTPVTFASLAGSPLIAVPLGFYGPDTPVVNDPKGDLITLAPGIPFPICFFAGRFEEEMLLKVAHAFQESFPKGPSTQMYTAPSTDLKDVIGKGQYEVPKI